MFITIQGIHINQLHIISFKSKENTVVVTDSLGNEELFYFTTEDEAKKEELKILKELNNAKNK